MTTIQLDDAQLAQFTACGLIVVDGEFSADGGERALQRMQRMNMPQGSDKLGRRYHQITGHPLLAPELWRKLTEPCPTCDGREWVFVDSPHKGDLPLGTKPCPNPDCVGGHQVVTLTARQAVGALWTYEVPPTGGHSVATCVATGADGRSERWHSTCGTITDWQRVNVPDDLIRRLGVVTLGRFTIRLLPCTEGWPWAQDVPGLDPLLHPGQWAVQFEAVG